MIPTSLLTAILFNLILSIALPMGIMLWLRRRGGRWPAFFAGAAAFVLFAMVLEQALHYLVLQSPLGGTIQENIWLYALYGGLAAGLFEETGRLAAFKLLLKKQTRPVTALSYGAGYGGMEAFLILGLTMVNNLAILFAYTGGGQLPAELEGAAATLLATPATLFLLGGFERVAAIVFHIANSVLVFAAARCPGKLWLFPLAIVTHMLVDFIAVTANAFFTPAITELAVSIFTVLAALLAAKVYGNLRETAEST